MGAARTAILFLAISVFLALPAFYGGEGGELDIWQQGLFAAAAPRRIVLEYRQAPFWNPWGSGGVPCLGHPYSSFLSPGYVFILVFGPVAGLKLRAAAALWAGLAGGWLLGRRFSPGRFAPFLCAGVYLFSSWYPLYISRWHAEFIPFCYLPWLFLCYLKGVDDLRWTAWGGIFLALMLLDGGTYPPPLAALLLGIYAVLDAGVRRSWRPVAAAAMVILLGLAISGVKLLPMARFIMDNPRYTYWREPVLPLRALPRIFLGRDQLSPTSFAGAWLGWWEYGAYVGVVPMTLAALGVFIGRRRIIPAAACAIVFFGVMLGDFGGPAPWRWLHRLPPFSSLHDTVRFRVPLVFCLALLSSAALSRVEEEGAPLRGGMRAAFLGLLGVLAAAATLDLVLVSAPLWGRLAIRPPPPSRPPGPFRQAYLAERERKGACVYRTFLGNEGLVNNWDGLDLKPADVRPFGAPAYRGEAWLEDGGVVETERWSPNELVYRVAPGHAGALVVNQRYDPGWAASGGMPVASLNGAIAVPVPPEGGTVTLRYRPPWLWAGCASTALGAFAACLLWRRGRAGFTGGGPGR